MSKLDDALEAFWSNPLISQSRKLGPWGQEAGRGKAENKTPSFCIGGDPILTGKRTLPRYHSLNRDDLWPITGYMLVCF